MWVGKRGRANVIQHWHEDAKMGESADHLGEGMKPY
jgi:hypothetical protein